MLNPGIAGISFEGDHAEGLKYVRAAKIELERLQQYMKAGGIEISRKYVTLSDTVTLFVHVGMNVNRIHIIAETSKKPTKPTNFVFIEEPDFLSGFVSSEGKIRPLDELHLQTMVLQNFVPTASCAKIQNSHSKITGAKKLRAGVEDRNKRLAILQSRIFAELQTPGEITAYEYSQYTKLRPSMYSGKMRAAVQLVMGYGKQNKHSIYRTATSEDDKINRKIITDKAYLPTDYQKRISKDGVNVLYDYRWNRTHGIYTTAAGTKWLVEISIQRGVLAMPLPVFDKTATADFKKKLTGGLKGADGKPIKDDDGLTVLNEFGGFPSGEILPIGPAKAVGTDLTYGKTPLDAAVACGLVVQLLSPSALTEFYQNSPYSSSMGWAFSASGKLANNTAYSYAPNGIMYGVHYGITLNIIESSIGLNALGTARLPTDITENAEKIRGQILAILKASIVREFKAYAQKDPPKEDELAAMLDVILRRLRFVSAKKLKELLDALHFLKATETISLYGSFLTRIAQIPIASSASATVAKLNQGNIYNGAKRNGPQIKFPEPYVGYLVSVDARLTEPDQGVAKPDTSMIRCDTIMHVFYRGEKLCYLKYYRGPAGSGEDGGVIEDETPDCPYIGQWNYSSKQTRQITVGFYSNEIDRRVETYTDETNTKFTGKDLGYYHVFISDNLADIRIGVIGRSKLFSVKSVGTRKIGIQLNAGVAIPFYDREAYYYATERKDGSSYTTTTQNYYSVSDPNYGNYRRSIVSTAGFPFNWQCGSKTDHRRKIESLGREETPCGDLADSGPWLTICQDVEHISYYIRPPPNYNTASPTTYNKRTYEVTLVCSRLDAPLLVTHKESAGADSPPISKFFLDSPDKDYGFTYTIFSETNCLGEAEILIANTDMEAGETKVVGTAETELLKTFPTFIGVNNA
jgi:hypothetical protein